MSSLIMMMRTWVFCARFKILLQNSTHWLSKLGRIWTDNFKHKVQDSHWVELFSTRPRTSQIRFNHVLSIATSRHVHNQNLDLEASTIANIILTRSCEDTRGCYKPKSFLKFPKPRSNVNTQQNVLWTQNKHISKKYFPGDIAGTLRTRSTAARRVFASVLNAWSARGYEWSIRYRWTRAATSTADIACVVRGALSENPIWTDVCVQRRCGVPLGWVCETRVVNQEH